MQVLEKIMEEIDEAIARYGENPYIDEKVTDLCYGLNLAKDIVRKYMENDGWIPVGDERLWNILFEEACVEGEQAMRIYNRLKETFGGERNDMNGKMKVSDKF